MEQSQTRSKVTQTLSILVVLLLFYAALWVLHRELRAARYEDVLGYLNTIPLDRLLAAFGMAMGSYLALGFHDALGMWHIKKKLALWKTLFTSFIAYAFSHSMGAAVLTGGGVRYRLYSAWGLTTGETASVLLICGATFWVGFISMGAVFFFVRPPDLPSSPYLPFKSVLTAGVICILVVAGYILSSIFVRKTIKIFRWHFPTPTPGMAFSQIVVGAADWACSGAALYLLLPASSLDFPSILAIYLLAQLVGFVSQVPGGLGVLETVVLLLLTPVIPASNVLGALLAFRVVYYLIPFAMGLVGFGTYEIVRNKEGFKRALHILNRWAPDFAPHLFSLSVFFGGAVLLFSNASPETYRRLAWLNEFLPLSFLEGSHLAAGLVGAGLLVTARGLQQKLESAYYLALVLLGLGVLSALFKGFDYQEALTLLAFFGALLPCRRYFPRKSSPFQQRYPPLWVAAILFIWLGSIWVGVFNYRAEDYSSQLWTEFGILEDAGRFLRTTLVSTVTLFLFSLVSLFTPAQPETDLPTPVDLEKVQAVLKNFRRSYAHLALLGDKALLFNKRSAAFLMYAIEGKSWVTLGDPVGTEKDQKELALKFKDLCRRNKGWPLFFGVDQDHFQFYLDMGLTVMKTGEEARVPLKPFKLEALASADLKNTYQRFKEKEDFTFSVLPAGEWTMLTSELKAVSESWLSKHKTREKGFSTGFFHETYLNHFPMAFVWKEGAVVAFANISQAGSKEEVAVDLLRSPAEAPAFVEDYLLLETMFWAREKGIKWFNLGVAPLLDLEESPLAPFKEQMAEIFRPYGAATGADIRKEKERFNPEWAPKYIAASGNLPLPVAFNNIRSLVSKIPRTGYGR